MGHVRDVSRRVLGASPDVGRFRWQLLCSRQLRRTHAEIPAQARRRSIESDRRARTADVEGYAVSDEAPSRIIVAADQATQQMVGQALKGEFDVVPAGPGLDVVEKAGAGDIECILLELKLRGLDGFDVCRRLKSEPRCATIPVLFLTNINDRADESAGFDVGASDYLTQPIKASILKARVRAHV